MVALTIFTWALALVFFVVPFTLIMIDYFRDIIESQNLSIAKILLIPVVMVFSLVPFLNWYFIAQEVDMSYLQKPFLTW